MCKDDSWATLSDEQFIARVQTLSFAGQLDPSMFSHEEMLEFYDRRLAYLEKKSKELSDVVGNVDLITPLRRLREQQRILYDAVMDDTGLYSPFEKEKVDQTVRKAAKRRLPANAGFMAVPGIADFFTLTENCNSLYIPRNASVGVDTNLLVYLAQRNVPAYSEKYEAVLQMFKLPLCFTISESTYFELYNVIMSESTPLDGIISKPPISKAECSTTCVRKCSGWTIPKGQQLSGDEIKHNKALREKIFEDIFPFLAPFPFAQSERSKNRACSKSAIAAL